MGSTIEATSGISSAIRCRLSGVEAPKRVHPDQQRYLLLQEIAQKAELHVRPVSRRRLFGRSR